MRNERINQHNGFREQPWPNTYIIHSLHTCHYSRQIFCNWLDGMQNRNNDNCLHGRWQCTLWCENNLYIWVRWAALVLCKTLCQQMRHSYLITALILWWENLALEKRRSHISKGIRHVRWARMLETLHLRDSLRSAGKTLWWLLWRLREGDFTGELSANGWGVGDGSRRLWRGEEGRGGVQHFFNKEGWEYQGKGVNKEELFSDLSIPVSEGTG